MVRISALLELTEAERRELQSLAGRRSTAQGLAERARIIVALPRVSRTNRWRPGSWSDHDAQEVGSIEFNWPYSCGNNRHLIGPTPLRPSKCNR
jgi:hypothetical protein